MTLRKSHQCRVKPSNSSPIPHHYIIFLLAARVQLGFLQLKGHRKTQFQNECIRLAVVLSEYSLPFQNQLRVVGSQILYPNFVKHLLTGQAALFESLQITEPLKQTIIWQLSITSLFRPFHTQVVVYTLYQWSLTVFSRSLHNKN